MGWLERIIAFFDPKEAVQRKQAQLVLSYLNELEGKRGYDGAKRGRLQQGWNARGTSANTEIYRDAGLLRARARDLVRNNPYAAKGKEVYLDHLIGAGSHALGGGVRRTGCGRSGTGSATPRATRISTGSKG